MKIISLIAKLLGLAIMLDWTSISPKYGLLIFAIASATKDAVNRIGDYLDDKTMNNSFPKVPLFLALAAAIAVAPGCQTTNTPGRVLASTAQTVDVAMKGYMQIVKAGLIKPETENHVRAAYAVYQAAMSAAESAYVAYGKTGDKTIWDQAAAALRASQSDLLTLIDLVTPQKP